MNALKGKVECQPLVSVVSLKDESRARSATPVTTNPVPKGQRMIKREQARVDSPIEVIDRVTNREIVRQIMISA